MMDIEQIDASYRAEIVAVFERLRDKVVAGELSPKEFLRAQELVYQAYRSATVQKG
jgi:hypothetical protein